jgi:hypothetical protein
MRTILAIPLHRAMLFVGRALNSLVVGQAPQSPEWYRLPPL